MKNPGVLAFAALALLLTMTPGADTLVLFRNVLRGGRLAGLVTAVGGRFGLLVHALLSAAGLSAVLAHSAAAYQALKLAGAAYLVFLGLRSLWAAWRPTPGTMLGIDSGAPSASRGRAHRSPFLEGFLTNVLNPKTAIFYLAFLPQFIGPGEAVLPTSLLLCGIHIVLSLLWYGLLCLAFGAARRFLVRPLVRRTLDAASGAVLAAFGLRLAWGEA